MEINQAVILSGGRGERLQPPTGCIPKPMVSMNGISFPGLYKYSIIQVGIQNILILLGHKANIAI